MSEDRPARPSRRGVLAGGAALLVTACTRAGDPSPPPGPTPDQRLAAGVADEIHTLLAAYAATIARHPAMRSELSTLAAEHDRHVAAFAELAPAPTAPAAGSRSPTASTSGSRSRTSSSSPPAAPTVPSSTAAALDALASAERAAAARRLGQTRRAGPELARLLASVAGCEAVHASLLGGAR